MLAGATYGASAIPSGWLGRLDRTVAAEIRQQIPKLLAMAASPGEIDSERRKP
jgi:ADP-ribosyl-[dinitrogen reductase] hydrolase